MKKILIILLIAVMLLPVIGTPVFAADEADVVISGASVTALPGETVEVPIVIEKNSGFCGLNLHFTYSNALTFVSFANSVSTLTCTNITTTVWDGADNYTGAGELAVLKFTVPTNAELGTIYAVQINFIEAYDLELKDVQVSVTAGSITVGGPVAAVYEDGAKKAQYSDFGKAVEACGTNGYVKLLSDAQVNVTLSKDLYVDLNGFDLSGTLSGGKVYGMDSTTNAYNCENRGMFSCVDASGAKVVPEIHFKSTVTGSVKRYMAIEEQSGYSFHRFYLGVTHMSIRPAVTSVGFKAAFYGDEMVVAALDAENAYGYSLNLTDGTPVVIYKEQASFVSGQAVTLRIDNYDVENHGLTVLSGKAMLKLSDGTVIESAAVTMTLRQLLENLNENPSQMTADQLKVVANMIEKYEILKSWNLNNLTA